MIKINEEDKTITLQFYEGNNPHVFNLLLGFVCPKCDQIIRAYWEDDNSSYNPLEYLPKQKMSDKSKPYYIAFRVPGGKGIELCNHSCSIFTHQTLEENIKAFIKALDYEYRSYSLNQIVFSIKRTNEEILEFLKQYDGELVFDVCGRELPFLNLSTDTVEGELDSRFQTYWGFQQYREKRIREFKAFFGLSKESNETEDN